MSTISAILLAAGESRRMGTVNKLNILIDGVPMLRHSVQILLAAQLAEIVVVVGHEETQSRAILQGMAVSIVKNDHYQQGQMTSVHTGLNTLSQDCDGIMICLADQPLLSPSVINTLIDAFDQRTHGSILVPRFQGKRGNPIILADTHRVDILQGNHNLGCKHLIENNPQWVSCVEMSTEEAVMDLDTPEDVIALKQKLVHRGQTLTIPQQTN